MTDQELAGGCQCGGIRYTISGHPIMTAVCHCTMCRKAHTAPSVAWALLDESQVTFTRGEPKYFNSSEDGQRGFCATCGSQICFTASYLQNLIDISIGSLDDPEAVAPTFHFWHSEHLSWAEYADNLPRHPEFPPLGKDAS